MARRYASYGEMENAETLAVFFGTEKYYFSVHDFLTVKSEKMWDGKIIVFFKRYFPPSIFKKIFYKLRGLSVV